MTRTASRKHSLFKPVPFALGLLAATALFVGLSAVGTSRWLRTWHAAEAASAVAVLACLLALYFSRRQRDRARAVAEEYRSIFETAHDAIVLFDPATEEVLNVNQRACEMYGLSREQLVGLSLRRLTKDVTRGQREIEHVLKTGSTRGYETVHLNRDGSEIALDINAAVIELQGRPVILSVMRDVTQRKKTDELRLAREADDRSQRAKAEFLAIVSHEMRTPLNGVLGMASALSDTPLSSEQRDLVGTLKRSGDNLLAIINEILDFSKIESGKLELEEVPFHLGRTVQEALDLVSHAAAAKGLSLACEIEAGTRQVLSGDVKRVRQVLANLLGNAVKFTDRGEVVVTAATRGTGDQVTVELAVRDTGIGIPPEGLDRLFQPFSQGDMSTTRKYGGTGLGLAICKRLCELMGGRLWVESRPDQGSTFTFSFAAREAAEVAAAPRAVPLPVRMSRGAQPKILLAEDNLINQKVALLMLRHLGLTAETATDGAEVLELLRRERFDLVLMDVHMPNMDGLEATRRLRREWPGEDAPFVVAMTAAAMREDREACRAAGMDDYLSKPLEIEDLEACVARALELRGPARNGTTVDESVLHALAALGDPGSPAVDEVIDIFLAHTPSRLSAMRRSLENGNGAELDHLNHALRGVASALGARAMCDVCAQIQERIRAGSALEPIVPFVDRLELEFHRVHQALAAWRRPVA